MGAGITDNLSCLPVGEGSLLIQCAESLLGRGHAIDAVATPAPLVRQWAAARGIPTLSQDSGLTVQVFA